MEDRKERESDVVDNGQSDIDEKNDQRQADDAVDESESSADDAEQDVAEEAGDEAESDRFIRLAAEFDNYKKRTAREFESIVRRANERLLRELVDIVDNFERALSAEAGDDAGEAYRKGVELIYNQLAGLLAKEGISAIESVGKPFDPTYHEAVMQVESDEFDEGVVVQEVQKGYKIDGKVLRHARVVVSKGPSGEDKDEDSENDE